MISVSSDVIIIRAMINTFVYTRPWIEISLKIKKNFITPNNDFFSYIT